jgi:hypothetical protein
MGIHGSGQQDTSCQPKPGGENVWYLVTDYCWSWWVWCLS